MGLKPGRMFLYVWSESSNPNECKFGERWVRPNETPATSVRARVRQSLGVRKDLLRTGIVSIDHIWDVHDYATRVGRGRQRARMDDYVRGFVGHRKGTTGEIHNLSSSELILKVNEHLAGVNQALPSAGLSTTQHSMCHQTLEAYRGGSRVVLAELCARFGKTIYSGAVARELGTPLVIVASYVKTVFASFAKDLTRFEQWSGYTHVDTQELGWQSLVTTSLKQGKPVVCYLSMCSGGQREARVKWLFSRKTERLLIVDEADYGSYRPGQAELLKKHVGKQDRVLIMTGTNADRASKLWQLDTILSVTYPELLIQKRLKHPATAPNLAHFAVDPSRDQLAPDMRLYQLDLSEPVMQSVASGEFDDEDMRLLPSWSKFAAHPQKSKGFFVRMLETVFLGKHGADAANVDLQTQNWFGRERQKTAMMFVPGSTRVKDGQLAAIGVIAQSALPAWRVIVLGGSILVDGHKVRNANAEQKVREQIEQAVKLNQSVLIISSLMAQRSFSIPEITELYLAYDSGEVGATIQKMSRVLTPGQDPNKVGKIISLSFDPNRDDKFDSMLLETTFNLVKQNPKRSAAEVMSEVLSTVDIWKGSAHDSVRVNKDSYLAQVLARKSISRVIGSTADLTQLNKEMIRELATGIVTYQRADPVASVPKGKIKLTQKKSKNTKEKDTATEEMRKARERITAIVENIDVIRDGSGCDQLQEALEVIRDDLEAQENIGEEFGVRWAVVQDLFDRCIIRKEWLELIYDKV